MEHFLYRSGAYNDYLRENPHERAERDFLKFIAKTGMTAVDVGGNYGYAAVAVANFIGESGRLYCFEPIPEYFDILESNIAANKLENTEAFQYAVGRRAGHVHLHKNGGSTRVIAKKEPGSVNADMISLDKFCRSRNIDKLDLLNMDCEGSELAVLQGAKGILADNKVRMFLEIHHGFLADRRQSVQDIVAFLKGLAYNVSSVSLDDLSLSEEYDGCEYLYARK